MSLRKIYYSMPAEARLLVRKVFYLPYDILFSKKGSPPKGKIYTGGGDFKATGERFVNYFIEYGGLLPNSKVLDIGSGIGRMALPLTKTLNSDGAYCGFDVVKQGVDWCVDNITKQYPNFEFKYVDLFNDLYKEGGEAANEFVFPCEADSFDIAISISVFTHLQKDVTAQYIKESERILRKGGRLFATFFTYDQKPQSTKKGFDFVHQSDDYALMDARVKDANVAYRLTWLKNIAQEVGLHLVSYHKGSWQGSEHALDFQDILVFEKRIP